MNDLLKNTYSDFESLRGRRLAITLISLFVLFVPLGILIGYLTNPNLSGDDLANTLDTGDTLLNASIKYTGKITYIDPMNYPEDEISYVLLDPDGKEIILLKSREKILEVSEGLTATVTGKVRDTLDGKEKYLLVSEVTISNATN